MTRWRWKKSLLSSSRPAKSSKKPAEVRQGKGKGSVEFWACRVKPGRIMFEVDGVSAEVAKRGFELAAAKLPVRTRVVTRMGEEF